MSLAEKSRINLLYLICSKEIIYAGGLKNLSAFVISINWNLS